jgi:large subunit ribosomal protein L15
MPLQRRVPKFGFTNIERVEFKPINLSTLEDLAVKRGLTEISIETLIEAGFVSKNARVKILGNGKLTKALTVSAHAFSKSAEAAIEGLQGKAITVGNAPA